MAGCLVSICDFYAGFSPSFLAIHPCFLSFDFLKMILNKPIKLKKKNKNMGNKNMGNKR